MSITPERPRRLPESYSDWLIPIADIASPIQGRSFRKVTVRGVVPPKLYRGQLDPPLLRVTIAKAQKDRANASVPVVRASHGLPFARLTRTYFLEDRPNEDTGEDFMVGVAETKSHFSLGGLACGAGSLKRLLDVEVVESYHWARPDELIELQELLHNTAEKRYDDDWVAATGGSDAA